MEEIREVHEIHFTETDGDGETFVMDAADDASAGETIEVAWDEHGIIRFEP